MDIGASNWVEDDNSNTTAAPDGAPEGMAPSGVNNVLRAHQGAIKRWYNWLSPKLTAGSGSAYTLTYSVAPGALVDGMGFVAELHVAPGAGATLDVNALGAIPIRHFYNGAWYLLPPAWCAANSIVRLIYHAASGVLRIADSVQAIPTGTSQVNRSSTTPAGWLTEDGSAISRTQYPALFAAIGTTYGAGDGSTTFNLPDSRGYVDAGVGGAIGGGLGAKPWTSTTASAGVSGTASGSLTVNVTGQQNGDYSILRGAQGTDGPLVAQNGATSTVVATGSASGSLSMIGSTSAFNIVQPTLLASKMVSYNRARAAAGSRNPMGR